jgi:dipeptidyl-peptidase-4
MLNYRRMRFYNLLFALLFIQLSVTSWAQTKKLTIEDAILKGRTTLAPQRLNQLSWIPGTNKYAYILQDGKDESLVVIDASTLKRESVNDLAASVTSLVENPEASLKKIPPLTWLGKDSVKFVHNNNIYAYHTTNRRLHTLSNIPKEAENADLSPGAAHMLAYTIKNNLYIAGEPTTRDENPGIVNGQAVHRNEFGISKGTFWSPKGTFLAYYRMDETMVTDYPIVDLTNRPAQADLIKYPMAGMKSHHVTLGVYDIETKSTMFLKTGEPAEQYLTNITWSPDEKYIYIAVVNREQNHMWLKQYDAGTGEFVKTLFEEEHAKYVEPEHGPLFPGNKGDEFVWFSERDGYNHLYLYNKDGKLLRQLTKGPFVVTEFLGFDKDGKNAFYMSTQAGPIERQAYSVEIKTAKVTRLTQGAGTHSCLLSSDGTYLIDNYSSMTVPREVSVITLKGFKKQVLLTATNPLTDYKLGQTSIFTIKTEDETDLYCRMIKPLNFDSTKAYPVIVYLYGGPHLQLINNTWLGGADLWMNYMAQEGYLVFTLDNRGSLNRGFDFESSVHRSFGTKEMTDQLKGVEYLKKLKYVDPKRIGVYGWSFGGFLTTTLMTRAPGTFKVAVAGGPVIDWKYYEVMYTERYMDTPAENPKGYEDSDLLKYVKNLEGKLMLIHGTSDDVVVWQHSLAFIKKCVDEGKLVDYFVYPGHKHNVMGTDRVHLFKKVTQYFRDNL